MTKKFEWTPSMNIISKWIRYATVGASIFIILSCSSNEEKYQKQLEKVQELEYKLKQQAENYHDISTQWKIQEDLKKEWADKTINQEIWYSIDRTRDQDKEISETKEELAKAQKKLAEMKEDLNYTRAKDQSKYNDIPNPDKYNYIPEEFKRGRKSE